MFGIYEKALDPRDDWCARLEKAKALGFDFLEICIDEQDQRIERLDWPRENRKRLHGLTLQTGVPLLSMCLSAHRRFPFGSADARTRKTARDIMDKAIDFALDLGIRTIQMAAYDVYYEPSTEESRALYLDGLRYAAQRAARCGVMLANEIMDTCFMNSISKHMAYERRIDSPYLRVYPDIGNLSAWGNDVAKELRLGAGSIVQVHLKDTLAVTDAFDGKFKCVPFGSGCVDFPLCLRTLEQQGYTGPYLMEMWYAEGTDDIAAVAAAKKWIEAKFTQSKA